MIKKAIIYFIGITLMLYLVRYLHYKGLLMNKEGYYAKYHQAFLEKNDYDVLFLGSSRAEIHYNTRVFDSITGRNSFNLSLHGASPHMSFAALKAYLEKSKAPEYLIYEVDYQAWKEEPVPFHEFNNYFPFLSNQTLRKEFQKIDRRTNLFYYLPYASLPFTGYKNISTGLHGWLNRPSNSNYVYYKGSVVPKRVDTMRYMPAVQQYSYILKNNRNYIDTIINFCKAKNIRVILCTSPAFGGFHIQLKNAYQLAAQIKNISKIHNLPYYNFAQTYLSNDRGLFADFSHLNRKGAFLFSCYFGKVFNNKMLVKPLK